LQWILAAGGVGLLAALWFLARGVRRLRREIGEAESRLARRFYTLQGRVAEIDATVRELEFERRRQRGEIRFDRDMPVEQAVAVHPRVREILAAFGIAGGGCSGPSLDGSLTIAEACRRASLDTGAVLAALTRFVEDPSAPIDAKAASAKLHRIRRPDRVG